ncbi:MAG: GIY-YIG nuclease family protein [Patescibacteria group bacterium]
MNYTVYVIKNDERGKIYIGHTGDLSSRLKRHNGQLPSKSSSFTSKNSGEWRLIYKENFATRPEATRREKELKSFRGREFLKNILDNRP